MNDRAGSNMRTVAICTDEPGWHGARLRAAFAAIAFSKFGEPISSSPSIMTFTFTGNLPFVFR